MPTSEIVVSIDAVGIISRVGRPPWLANGTPAVVVSAWTTIAGCGTCSIAASLGRVPNQARAPAAATIPAAAREEPDMCHRRRFMTAIAASLLEPRTPAKALTLVFGMRRDGRIREL